MRFSSIADLLSEELRINMKDKEAESKIVNLLNNYIKIPSHLSIINSITSNDVALIRRGLGNMLSAALQAGFPNEYWSELKINYENFDQFRVNFTPVPGIMPPLKVKIQQEARPVRIKLRNYSQDQEISWKI